MEKTTLYEQHCSQCGAMLRTGVHFCEKCGQPILVNSTISTLDGAKKDLLFCAVSKPKSGSEQAERSHLTNDPEQMSQGSALHIAAIILLVVVLIVLAVAGGAMIGS